MKVKASQNDQNGSSLGLPYTVYTGVTILLPKAGRLKRSAKVSTGYHELGVASLQLKIHLERSPGAS